MVFCKKHQSDRPRALAISRPKRTFKLSLGKEWNQATAKCPGEPSLTRRRVPPIASSKVVPGFTPFVASTSSATILGRLPAPFFLRRAPTPVPAFSSLVAAPASMLAGSRRSTLRFTLPALTSLAGLSREQSQGRPDVACKTVPSSTEMLTHCATHPTPSTLWSCPAYF